MLENDPPIAVLVNGLRVANFSSAHTFIFDDGTVLAACSDKRARSMTLEPIESDPDEESFRGIPVTSVRMGHQLPAWTRLALEDVVNDPAVDIVLVPRVILDLVREHHPYFLSKVRGIRLKDRVKQISYSNLFCK